MQAPACKMVHRMLRPLPLVDDPRVAHGHISSFTTRQLTNTLWAFARLELHSAALYDAGAMALLPQMRAVADKGLVELAATYTSPAVKRVTMAQRAMPLAVAMAVSSRVHRGQIVPNALAEACWLLWTDAHGPASPQKCPAARDYRRMLSAAAGVSRACSSEAAPALGQDSELPVRVDTSQLQHSASAASLERLSATDTTVREAMSQIMTTFATISAVVRLALSSAKHPTRIAQVA